MGRNWHPLSWEKVTTGILFFFLCMCTCLENAASPFSSQSQSGWASLHRLSREGILCVKAVKAQIQSLQKLEVRRTWWGQFALFHPQHLVGKNPQKIQKGPTRKGSLGWWSRTNKGLEAPVIAELPAPTVSWGTILSMWTRTTEVKPLSPSAGPHCSLNRNLNQ